MRSLYEVLSENIREARANGRGLFAPLLCSGILLRVKTSSSYDLRVEPPCEKRLREQTNKKVQTCVDMLELVMKSAVVEQPPW